MSLIHTHIKERMSVAKRARVGGDGSDGASVGSRYDRRLNTDVERRIADHLDSKSLGRWRMTERNAREGALQRKYSAAVTTIKVPYRQVPNSFFDQYTLSAITHIEAGSSPITDENLQYVAQRCPQLTFIRLNKWCDITNTGVTALAQHCPQLNTAYLSGLNITDASVMALARHCRKLKYLWLSECMRITDAAVIAIAQNCPELIRLDLFQCRNITDESVIALARCTELKLLMLTFTGVREKWRKPILDAQTFFDENVRNGGAVGNDAGGAAAQAVPTHAVFGDLRL